MHLIEIATRPNGSHNEYTISIPIIPPDGWAVIPADMELPATFPFINIETEGEKITALTANQEAYDAAIAAIPEPDPDPQDDIWTALDNAYSQGYTEGVNNV